jgi:hypothetical protein
MKRIRPIGIRFVQQRATFAAQRLLGELDIAAGPAGAGRRIIRGTRPQHFRSDRNALP